MYKIAFLEEITLLHALTVDGEPTQEAERLIRECIGDGRDKEDIEDELKEAGLKIIDASYNEDGGDPHFRFYDIEETEEKKP